MIILKWNYVSRYSNTVLHYFCCHGIFIFQGSPENIAKLFKINAVRMRELD